MPDETRLDQPREAGRRLRRPSIFTEGAFGTASEKFARFMGTPRFLIGMSIFCAVWLAWNTLAPETVQFDPRSLNFTLLTLILSLQASYAAPLLLLAQNRQDDRDRVTLEQDRARDERNLADTEFLTREVAALRVALRDVVTRDYLRSELRELLEEVQDRSDRSGDDEDAVTRTGKKKNKNKSQARPRPEASPEAGPAAVERATNPADAEAPAPGDDGTSEPDSASLHGSTALTPTAERIEGT